MEPHNPEEPITPEEEEMIDYPDPEEEIFEPEDDEEPLFDPEDDD